MGEPTYEDKLAAAVYVDLRSHSEVWERFPVRQVAGLIYAYKDLAEKLARSYGCFYNNFTGDGHLFLFDNTDSAVQFGLKLIDSWQNASNTQPSPQSIPHVQMRLGCHYGRVLSIPSGHWVGTGIIVANRIQSAAEPDSLWVSNTVYDLIDKALYEYELKRDDPDLKRYLYRVLKFNGDVLAARPEEELSAEEWFLKAVAMIGTEKENSQEQVECYTKALELRPDNPQAYYNRGVAYGNLREHKKALADYTKALELRPDDPEAYYNRGGAYIHLEKYQEAIADYNRALELRPDLPVAYNNRGIAYRGLREHQRAIQDYTRALELRPNYPVATYNMAWAYSLMGNKRAMLEWLGKAIGLAGESRVMARADKGFERYWDDPDFQALASA